QIVFLKNEGSIGVKNGMLAKVVQASAGRVIAQVGEGEHLRQVVVEQRFYNAIDYGYATTIHKSQGATVDRVKVLASLSLDRHLAYVAMTRHREDLAVYYGQKSFATAGGLIQILSRSNAKETTLDYSSAAFYAQALRFAEARGLHLINVARTIVHDQVQWTVRQTAKVLDLGARLAAVAARFGIGEPRPELPTFNANKAVTPMVSGTTIFSTAIGQAVEDKLAADPALKDNWEAISFRFHSIYADPEAAFKAVNVDAMLADKDIAKGTIERLAGQPESFGTLKGKTGFFAGRAQIQARDRALVNVPALVHELGQYLSRRSEVLIRFEEEERAARAKVSIDIPALSSRAMQVLERARNAIDRNDLPAGLAYALADQAVKSELDGFAKAAARRFGERAFLPLAAKTAEGQTFEALSAGMQPAQKSELRSAWATLRTVQQLAAHERTTIALRQAEVLRQSQSKGLSLK
ncbi:MAG: BID domain-containing protein, partial [Rhizobiaceae bacterium]|nr:BID domain-containing protein [Rhizobiaceae bacterium]